MTRKQKKPADKENSRLKPTATDTEQSLSEAEQRATPNLFDSLEAADGARLPEAKKSTAGQRRKKKTTVAKPDRAKAETEEPTVATKRMTAQAPMETVESAEETGEQYIPVGEEQPMTVGAHLAIARKNAGLDIEQVSQALRLRPSQIKAIENGQYELLPGQTFVTGFLRSYANFLNLDAVDVVQMFKDEDAGKTRSPDLVFPEPAQEGRMPGFGLLIAVSLGAVVIFAGWNYYELRSTVKLEYVETVPEHLAERIDKVAEPSDQEEIRAPRHSSEAEPPVEFGTSAPDIEISVNTDPGAAVNDTPLDVAVQSVAETAEIVTEPVDVIASNQNLLIDDPEISKKPVTLALAPDMAVSEQNEDSLGTEAPTDTGVAQDDKNVARETGTEEAVIASTATTSSMTPEMPATVEPAPVTGKFAGTELMFEQKQPLALGIENTDARIVIRARQDSWISIYADDGPAILTRILHPGDSFMVPNQPDLKLMTGNAGGLEIRVDGKNIPPLGEKGAIISDFHLVAEELLHKAQSSN